jgi:hypothetical protein
MCMADEHQPRGRVQRDFSARNAYQQDIVLSAGCLFCRCRWLTNAVEYQEGGLIYFEAECLSCKRRRRVGAEVFL